VRASEALVDLAHFLTSHFTFVPCRFERLVEANVTCRPRPHIFDFRVTMGF